MSGMQDVYEIRSVWQSNFEEEIRLIGKIIKQIRYIALDTEFPGDETPMLGNFSYEIFRRNVNRTKMIQLGLVLADENGEIPIHSDTGKRSVWEFNLKDFDPAVDPQNSDSVSFLERSGFNFRKLAEYGIGAEQLEWELLKLNLIFNDTITWVTFHGIRDFGFFMKLMCDHELPKTEDEFIQLMKNVFPTYHDIKIVLAKVGYFGGLNSIANRFGVKRIGSAHFAASDSLVTLQLFNRIKAMKNREEVDLPQVNIDEFAGILHKQ